LTNVDLACPDGYNESVMARADDMKAIWAPWRIEYIQMEKPRGCILCDKPREDRDEANHILYRGKYNFVMMNNYPYNPGHLMIAVYRHAAGLDDLNAEELQEHGEIITLCIRKLREVFKPMGFNIGTNMGRIAGAGIEDHVHTHIVPRWSGDTNFMPVIGDTRVIPEAVAATYRRLKERF
jgi:ATP adenylyltransferase